MGPADTVRTWKRLCETDLREAGCGECLRGAGYPRWAVLNFIKNKGETDHDS